MSDDPAARLATGAVAFLSAAGRTVTSTQRLHGGTIARTIRLGLDDGSSVVLKQRRSVPAGTWEAEVDGLEALRPAGVDGIPDVPAVLAVGDDFLLLEDLGFEVPDGGPFWETFGRRLATLHAVHGPRFGWHRDNMLGAVDQHNGWFDDGWTFFAEQRLLRYLELDNVRAALSPADRTDLEHLAGRLRDLVPDQPASLTHGDLWRSNVLAAGPDRPALCDPAVSYAWPDTDVSMLWCSGGVPDACFAAYREIRPLPVTWRDHLPLLHLREELSVLAHVGPDAGTHAKIRTVIDRYR